MPAFEPNERAALLSRAAEGVRRIYCTEITSCDILLLLGGDEKLALIPTMAQSSRLRLHRVYLGYLYVCSYHYNWCVHPISHCIYLTFFSRLLSLATMKTKRKMYPTSPAPSEPTSITCTPTLQLTTSFTILVGMPFWMITPYESLSRSWRLPTGRRFNVQGRSSSSTSLASKYVFQEGKYRRQRRRRSLPYVI